MFGSRSPNTTMARRPSNTFHKNPDAKKDNEKENGRGGKGYGIAGQHVINGVR